eukprot:TRINITY_DN7904_c0_g1_i1.p1 TRINITY_DN7904_c0_g1~~TRINITY_DN7904_c0_g1_i1.p1  ORF type:complete len:511 (-),score=166.62 TRINITY_DN7904_c0_g1_i1:33-1565(-)
MKTNQIPKRERSIRRRIKNASTNPRERIRKNRPRSLTRRRENRDIPTEKNPTRIAGRIWRTSCSETSRDIATAKEQLNNFKKAMSRESPESSPIHISVDEKEESTSIITDEEDNSTKPHSRLRKNKDRPEEVEEQEEENEDESNSKKRKKHKKKDKERKHKSKGKDKKKSSEKSHKKKRKSRHSDGEESNENRGSDLENKLFGDFEGHRDSEGSHSGSDGDDIQSKVFEQEGISSGKVAQISKKKREEEQQQIIMEFENSVADFLQSLEIAIDSDIDANRRGEPSFGKLKLLPELTGCLSKKHLRGIFIERGGMAVVRRCLEPLPDASLPFLKIREEILRILLQIPLDSNTLEDSGIGKIVNFLSRHPHETLANKRIAFELVDKWSRVIFGLSSNYKDLNTDDALRAVAPKPKAPRPVISTQSEIFVGSSNSSPQPQKTKSSSQKRHRTPHTASMDYAKRPVSQISLGDIEPSKKKDLSDFEKRLQGLQKKKTQSRSSKVSVEGRGFSGD